MRHFARHYVEMVIVMFAGMAVLGMPAGLGDDGIGTSWDELVRRAGAMFSGMAVTMVVPMVGWMRFRGHGWRANGEMSLSMVAADARRDRRCCRPTSSRTSARCSSPSTSRCCWRCSARCSCARRSTRRPRARGHAAGDGMSARQTRRLRRRPRRSSSRARRSPAVQSTSTARRRRPAWSDGPRHGDGTSRAASRPRPRGQRARPDARARAHDRAARRAARPASGSPTARGGTVRGFDVEHTKRMHLIVVRRDMTGFQHLHPTQGADGSWSVAADAAPSRRVPRVRRLLRRRRRRGRSPPTCASTARSDATRRCRRPRRPRRRRRLRRALTEGAPAGASPSSRFTVTRDGRPVALRGLPRRQGPPRRAARGRPRLPARPSRRAQPARSRPPSRPRAATACSCSSRTTAASTPPRSPRR